MPSCLTSLSVFSAETDKGFPWLSYHVITEYLSYSLMVGNSLICVHLSTTFLLFFDLIHRPLTIISYQP